MEEGEVVSSSALLASLNDLSLPKRRVLLQSYTRQLSQLLSEESIDSPSKSEPHNEFISTIAILVRSTVAFKSHERKWLADVNKLLSACLTVGVESSNFKDQVMSKLLDALTSTRSRWCCSGCVRLAVVNLATHCLRAVTGYHVTDSDPFIALIGEVIESSTSTDVLGSIESNELSNHTSYLSLLWRNSPEYMAVCSKVWWSTELLAPLCCVHMHNRFSGANALELYNKRILAAKSPPSATLLRMLGPFVASIDQQEWSGPIIASQLKQPQSEPLDAIATRWLKKAPEGSSRTVACLCTQLACTIDVSAFAQAGAVVSAVKMLKSSLPGVRCNGLRLLVQLARRCQQVEAQATLIRALLDAAQGKGGQLPLPSSRHMLHIALAQLANHINLHSVVNLHSVESKSSPQQETFIEAVTVLSTSMEKEQDEAVRGTVAIALGEWVAAAPDIPLGFIDSLKSNLGKAKTTVTGAYITSLAITCRSKPSLTLSALSNKFQNPKFQHFDAVSPLLVAMVKDASGKTLAVQPEAALAMEVLLILAAHGVSTALSGLTASKLWSLVDSAESPMHVIGLLEGPCMAGYKAKQKLKMSDDLLSSVYEGTSEEEELSIMLHCKRRQTDALSQSFTSAFLSATRLQPAISVLVGAKPSEPGLVNSIVFALLHPSAIVRRQANIDVREAYNNLDGLVTVKVLVAVFIDALSTKLESLAVGDEVANRRRLAEFKANGDEERIIDTVSRMSSSPSAIRAALVTLLSHSKLFDMTDECGILLAHTLLILGHLTLGSGTSRWVLYSRLGLMIPDESEPSQTLRLSEEQECITIEILLSRLMSPTTAVRTSAQRALLIWFETQDTTSVERILTKLIPRLLSFVEQCNLSELSSEELAMYRNPEAAVAAVIAKSHVKEDEVKITNADRKKDGPRAARRGLFGADTIEDDDWAERIRMEKAKKLALDRSGGIADVESKARLEVEEVVQRVNCLTSAARSSLDCLACLLQHSSGLVSVVGACVLASSVNVILEAAAEELLTESANVCLAAAASLVDSDLAVYASDLIASLRAVALSRAAINGLELSQANSSVDKSLALNKSPSSGPLFHAGGPIARLIRGVWASPRLATFRRARLHITQQEACTSPELASCLSEPTVYLLLPVLKAVLTVSSPLPGCESAFALLDCAWPLGSMEIPSRQVLRSTQLKGVLDTILRAALHVGPRLDPRPEDVLSRVLSQLTDGLTLSETLPLVGDSGFLCSEASVRLTCSRAFAAFVEACPQGAKSRMNPLLESRLWLAQYDGNEEVAAAGKRMWAAWAAASGGKLSESYYPALCTLFSNDKRAVRSAACRAMAGALAEHPASALNTIEGVTGLFAAHLPPTADKPRATGPSPAPIQINLTRAPAKATPKVDPIKALLSGGKIGGPTPTLKPKPTAPVAAPVVPITTAPRQAQLSAQAVQQAAVRETTRESVGQFFAALGSQGALQSLLEPERRDTVCTLLEFILQQGAIDPSSVVRDEMVSAGRALVDAYCGDQETCRAVLGSVRAVLALKLPSKATAEDADAFDNRHEAGVVLLGAVGKHLGKDDPAVLEIADALSVALGTPSESVQRTVGDCLAPLVQVIKSSQAEFAGQLLEKMLKKALTGENYGERRGGAYGLSACVKGLGLPALKQFDVVGKLKEACTNGAVSERQGSLFALECLADRLGLLFEPYVITVVPALLKSFSHASDNVRDAAAGAARAIMSRLSAHGVKQMLAPVLNSLAEESQWKSRQEAIRLLGAFATCAPKQLSSCLPQIVPRLVEAGSDPHPKVKESAKEAMAEIAAVIRSPELSRLSPVLLLALGDPANKTKDALEALLECEFMHSIDAPSLALLAPILGRALKDRAADVKRKGSAITGNIMTMVTEPKTLLPYMSALLPGLQACLVDPIPDVRATSAKALGALLGGVGETEEETKEVVPWLFVTLVSDSSPVERSGAAQGLAEVCLAMGDQKLRQVLEDALPLQWHSRSAAREGLLWLLSFLPAAMGGAFGPLVPSTLPVILGGLSDEGEGVREVALRAGQVLVGVLGRDFSLEIIPALREGMCAEDHRIRLSAVQLLGELLYLVADTRAVGLAAGADEDDDDLAALAGATRVTQAIRSHLGEHTADAVFAAVYIARSDLVSAVRHAALQVWKSVVSNTPKTLLEVTGELVQQCVVRLSAASEDSRAVAGRALGEVVKKLGDRVLPVVMPHLQRGLASDDPAARQGVCLGLAEILQACTRRQAEDYLPLLVAAQLQALSDESEAVRTQAARAFQTLFRSVGMRAVEEVVPPLLDSLTEVTRDSEGALLALRELVQARPRDLLEFLLPRLAKHPMEESAARVLSAVADVCSNQLVHHFGFLAPMFAKELESTEQSLLKLQEVQSTATGGIKGVIDVEATSSGELDNDDGEYEDIDEGEDVEVTAETEQRRLDAIKSAAAAVFGAVGPEGVSYLLNELGAQIERSKASQTAARRWGCWILEQFLRGARADAYVDYVPLVLRYLLGLIADTDYKTLVAMVDAFSALVSSCPLDNLITHFDFMKNCISSAASDARHRPGFKTAEGGTQLLPVFSLPKALDPFVSLYLHGLLNGSTMQREAAAEAIADMVVATEATALKPYLIKTTGPLIRVLGDRYPSEVKSSVLRALIALIDKGGIGLKAFAPQLQTTFVKSLGDPSKLVRSRAVHALSMVMNLSARVDPLLTELCALCATGATTGPGTEGDAPAGSAIKASVLAGINAALQHSGDKASPASVDRVRAAAFAALGDEDSAVRLMAARCVSGLAAYMEGSALTDLVLDLMGPTGPTGSSSGSGAREAGRTVALAGALQSGGHQCSVDTRDEALAAVRRSFAADKPPPVRLAACQAVGLLLEPPTHSMADPRRVEYKACAVAALQSFADCLSLAAGDEQSGELRKMGISAIKEASKRYPAASLKQAQKWVPPLVSALKDINIRVKFVAERALLHLLDGGNATALASFEAGAAAAGNSELVKFLRDYTKTTLCRLSTDSDNEGDKW